MIEGSRGLPPRILFLINSLSGGGAERVLISLLAASHDMQDEFRFGLVLLDAEPPRYAVPPWLEVDQLDSRYSLFRSVVELRRLLAKHDPALVLSFLTRSNMANVIAARFGRHRAIVSERGNTRTRLRNGVRGAFARTLVRQIYPRADRVIAVSRGVADGLTDGFGVDPALITTIANPIDANRIRAAAAQPVPPVCGGPYAISVSRLIPVKNLRLMIDAFAASALDMKLVIFGEGPERAALEAKIAAEGLGERVLLPGFTDNPFPHVARARFYVNSSDGEGFPNALVEAMALGVPVVATNCRSGPSEILADLPRDAVSGTLEAPHGLLVPERDVEALARGMRRLNEPELHRRYALAGPARAADYDAALAKRRYWNEIREVLRGGGEACGKSAA